MERRTLLATAGAVTLTVLAGGSALAANLGILDDDETGPVGELTPISLEESGATRETVPPRVVVVDEPVTVPGTGPSAPAPSAPPATAPSATAPSGPAATFDDDHDDDDDHDVDDDDDHDDDDDQDDDDHDDDHDDEDEYEGRDDDD